jgi:hypothetical protein
VHHFEGTIKKICGTQVEKQFSLRPKALIVTYLTFVVSKHFLTMAKSLFLKYPDALEKKAIVWLNFGHNWTLVVTKLFLPNFERFLKIIWQLGKRWSHVIQAGLRLLNLSVEQG